MKNYPSVLPPFVGVAFGASNAQCVLQGGPTYDEIIFALSGCVAADVVNITMTINGETIFSMSGPQMNMMQAYRGLPVISGYLTMRFADIAMKTLDAQNLTGLATSLADSIIIYVTLGAGSGTPSITGELHTSVGKYSRWIMPYQLATAQNASLLTDQLFNLPGGFGYQTIHMIGQSTGISRLQVFRQKVTTPGAAGTKIWDRVVGMNNVQLARNGRVPQTFGGVPVFHFDPSCSGFGNQAMLRVPKEDILTLDYNNAATGNVTFISEAIKQIGPNPHMAAKAAGTLNANNRQTA